ncbi:L,D-transpeptidase [Oscillatoriales cyanobacterium LEGE 11467]|uniref:L,D-transpeptidase n=1 Tax=Zarconia navalis LEGE 11467 TaxID=1828826 RepID=A0A928W3F5_9CYAN|nr:L,D-transpeptidase [Zarconia navalis]MBE9042545.1 L,D-transpeptidase [Zarconia navalis LEGE 11467]
MLQFQNLKARNTFALIILIFSSFGLYVQLSRFGYTVPLHLIPDVFCLKGCSSSEPLHPVTPDDTFLDDRGAVSKLFNSENFDENKVSVLVEKSKFKLTVFFDGEPIRSYPMVLGGNPSGDKSKEGDRKTPEGIFSIQDMYPHPEWSIFFWLDYPTPESWRKHLKAKWNGEIGWFDRVGSEIGIHGVPAGADSWIDAGTNWTWGCVSLKNEDIEELDRIVQVGTLVEIIP